MGDLIWCKEWRPLIEAAELFRKYILAGRIPVERWSHSRAVNRAFGRIREAVGAPFEKAIARDCERIVGKDCVVPSKNFISDVKTAPNLGEVGVFVVDRRHRRFVLAEAKNGTAAGGVPLSMLDERREFLDDFLSKLKEKSTWFRSHVSELKKEFGIPAEEVYKFEEVIVVKQLRLWVLLSGQALPVLDDDEFLSRLGAGQDMLSDPVLRSSETS